MYDDDGPIDFTTERWEDHEAPELDDQLDECTMCGRMSFWEPLVNCDMYREQRCTRLCDDCYDKSDLLMPTSCHVCADRGSERFLCKSCNDDENVRYDKNTNIKTCSECKFTVCTFCLHNSNRHVDYTIGPVPGQPGEYCEPCRLRSRIDELQQKVAAHSASSHPLLRTPHPPGPLGASSASRQCSPHLPDVIIQGFQLRANELFQDAEICGEEDWDELRRAITSSCPAKEEPRSESDDDGFGEGEIRKVNIHCVFNVQRTCSDRFKDGRTLESTIDELKRGAINHLKHPKFVLNVAMARIRIPVDGRRHAPRTAMFWTCDHRRLECMRQAGCKMVMVRVKLCGESFDEFMNKGAADDVGRRTGIRINKRRRI